MSRQVALLLAEWVAGLSAGDLSAGALRAARRLLVDRVGISLGGARLAAAHASAARPTAHLASSMNGAPRATVLAQGTQAFAPYAGLANGCAGDDLELAAGPECVESALAAAELSGATVGELLTAMTAGCEVGAYLRGWLSVDLEGHGLHPPAILGSVSAAAAVGRLLGFDTPRLAQALTTAACLTPMAPYGAFSAGSPAKTLYGGYPHFLALWSCLWAGRGVGGPASAFEGRRGLAQAIVGARSAAEPPELAVGDRCEIEKIVFKRFGCNRACHPALSALSGLGAFAPREVRRIDVMTYPYAVEIQRRHLGPAPMAAQVSIRHTVALFLALGGLPPGRSYTTENLSDPVVERLVERVFVDVDPELDTTGPRTRGARVRVELEDGSIREASVREPLWGASAPPADADLLERARELSGAHPLVDLLWRSAQTDRVADLIQKGCTHA